MGICRPDEVVLGVVAAAAGDGAAAAATDAIGLDAAVDIADAEAAVMVSGSDGRFSFWIVLVWAVLNNF